jgi:drug/metabolite transporter (DMT)-like permease
MVQQKVRPKKRWLILVLLSMVLMATIFPAMKYLSSDLNPLLIASMRYLFGWLIIAAIVVLGRHPVRVTWKQLGILTLLGVLGNISGTVALIYGIKLSSSANTAILLNSQPIFILLLSVLIWGKHPSRGQGLAAIVGFVGIVCVNITPGINLTSLLKSDYFWGNVIAIAGAALFALYTIWSQRLLKKFSSVFINFWSFLTTWLLLLAVTLPQQGSGLFDNVTLADWGILAYIGIFATAFVFLIWTGCLHYISPVNLATQRLLIPIVATLFAVFILNEQITIYFVAGLVLILISIFIIQTDEAKLSAAS